MKVMVLLVALSVAAGCSTGRLYHPTDGGGGGTGLGGAGGHGGTGGAAGSTGTGGCPATQHDCSGTCKDNDSVQACGPNCIVCTAPTGATPICSGGACDFTCDSSSQHKCPGMCADNNSPQTCGTSCSACNPPDGAVSTCNGTDCGYMCTGNTPKDCGQGVCVGSTQCCLDSECPPLASGQTGACDSGSHMCNYNCPMSTTRPCTVNGNTTCIPTGSCCINSDCTGNCMMCNSSHTCVAAKSMDDPNGRCPGTCDTDGSCKSKQGQTCNTVTAGCVSTAPCSPDGYCCNMACSGPCVACDFQGLQGMCQNLAPNAAPHSGHSPCMGSGTCAGACGANASAGTCVYPTTSCGSVTCSGTGSMVGVGTCSMGTCNYPSAQPCGGHLTCSNNACKLSCTADADCVSGYFCEATTCHRTATAVAAGQSHSCALLSDGTVWCWGDNFLGELGQGSFTTTGNQAIPTPVQVPLSKPATAVQAGAQASYALLNDGTVWAWGANSLGQLGQGTFTVTQTGLNGIPSPVKVMGLSGTVSAIASTGTVFACAIISGSAWCWGGNGHCQLGNGTCTNSSPFGIATPVMVQGLPSAVTGIATGGAHTCVNMGGAVRCWGDNSIGAVGTGNSSISQYSTPQFINLTTPTPLVTAISAQSQNTCLLSSSGTVYCWGNNFEGECGNGTFTTTAVFTGAPIANAPSGPVAATNISTGLDHSCALTQAGTVYCWGENDNGELGNGSFSDPNVQIGVASPGLVTGLPMQVSAISSGGQHTCALLKNGSVWCWGYNNSSQLGNNSAISAATPVQVSGW